jgi:hypothetical protein
MILLKLFGLTPKISTHIKVVEKYINAEASGTKQSATITRPSNSNRKLGKFITGVAIATSREAI